MIESLFCILLVFILTFYCKKKKCLYLLKRHRWCVAPHLRVILHFTVALSTPSVYPLVSCNESGDPVTIGCLAKDFAPDSLAFQWSPSGGVSAVQYPSFLEGSKYAAVSLVRVPRSEWISGASFDCSVIHNGTVHPTVSIRKTTTPPRPAVVPAPGRNTPPPTVAPSVSAAWRQPEVTVHVPPEEVINERPGEVTLVCLVSSRLRQNYNIRWLEYIGRRTGNYQNGSDAGPFKTSRGDYAVSSVYVTTKKLWQTHTFECNVGPVGSHSFPEQRAVSRAQRDAVECSY